ncbi:hypothetical protein AWZ03_014991, partial [Drosophila navojoa]
MIAHIREVRSIRNLDIDMRIGVHSGSLMAGVMGAAKLQYDVWGEDVIIAVNIYLTSLAKHQLYAENYKMVAVMFASLQDFKMDVRNLRILNEIISQFDKI